MSQVDPKLIDQVVRQVLEQLRHAQPQAGNAPTPAAPAPADIHPPIGVCTGDYSKFPELAAKAQSPAPAPVAPASPSSAPAAAPPATTPALKGIVTASQLQAAMDAAPEGVAVLAADARLSPLANDLARLHPHRLRRLGTPQGERPAAAHPAALDPQWSWWIDGYCPAVQELTTQRRHALRPTGAIRHPSSLSQVIKELAAAVKTHRVQGGVLFVHHAALAMCMANRCPSLRAVAGTCVEAVDQGVRELGANVLVIEYPHHGLKSMSAMVDRLAAQLVTPPAHVERELSELHRQG